MRVPKTMTYRRSLMRLPAPMIDQEHLRITGYRHLRFGVFMTMLIIGMALSLASIIAVATIAGDRACHQAGRNLRIAVRYEIPSGCYYADNGRYIPADQWYIAHPEVPR